ncbi:MAG: lipid II flippase MurJ [Pseudomonadota bacterium]
MKRTRSGFPIVRKSAFQFSGQLLGLLLALVVSHMIARRLGAGPEADAFILGRRLITSVTESLNQVVAIVFIPMVAAQAAAGASVWAIVSRTVGPALVCGAGLSMLFLLGASGIVKQLAPAFDPGAREIAQSVIVALSLSFPAVVGSIALVSFCNVQGAFGAPAAVRQIPRAAVAVALALALGGSVAITAAWAYTIAAYGTAAVMLLIALQLHRQTPCSGLPRPEGAGAPALARRSLAALMLTTGSLSFLWIETYVAAAQGAGHVTFLEYSQRLGSLLGHTLAAALMLVVFTDLTRRAEAGETSMLGAVFQRATVLGLAMLMPVTLGVVANAGALVELVLNYGSFAGDTGRDRLVLLVQIIATAPVTAWVLRMMYVRIVADRSLPMVRLIALALAADLIARVFLFRVLTPWFGLVGIPLALVLSPMAPMLVLTCCLRGTDAFSRGTQALGSVRPVLLTSAVVSVAVVGATLCIPHVLTGLSFKSVAAWQLVGSALAGAAVIALSVLVFQVRPKLEERAAGGVNATG